MSWAYTAACVALGVPLFCVAVIGSVDLLERLFTRWHEDVEIERARRLHPSRKGNR